MAMKHIESDLSLWLLLVYPLWSPCAEVTILRSVGTVLGTDIKWGSIFRRSPDRCVAIVVG
jgi:hypothetical protein